MAFVDPGSRGSRRREKLAEIPQYVRQFEFGLRHTAARPNQSRRSRPTKHSKGIRCGRMGRALLRRLLLHQKDAALNGARSSGSGAPIYKASSRKSSTEHARFAHESYMDSAVHGHPETLQYFRLNSAVPLRKPGLFPRFFKLIDTVSVSTPQKTQRNAPREMISEHAITSSRHSKEIGLRETDARMRDQRDHTKGASLVDLEDVMMLATISVILNSRCRVESPNFARS